MFGLRTRHLAAAATFLALLLMASTAGQAQDVSYTTVSRTEFGGALGSMMRMVPGAQDPSEQTTHIKGSLLRTDDGESSTIVDVSQGRFTQLDHGAKTWYTFAFADMAAQMQGAQAQMQEAQAQEEAQDRPEIEYETKFSVDRTGKKQNMGGYSAEQVLMTIEIIPKVAPEEGAEPEEAGTMVLLNELWMSTDFPGYEAWKNATERMAEDAAGSMQGMASSLQQAFASDPRMKEAFEKSAEEMKGLEGLAVKTVSSFVMVPVGVPFDREAVLASADQPLAQGPDMGGMAAAGAREAARSAVSGLTGGLLGRRRQQQQPEEEAAPAASQMVMTRVTSQVQDVKGGSLPESLFQPPAGYTETAPPWIKDAGN